MNEKYERVWNAHKRKLSELIRIPSVYDEASVSESAPYGEPARDALSYMRGLCEDAGFDRITEYGNAVLSASYGDPAGGRIDIASHLDVVAVDDGWDGDPFSGAIRDGYVWGRGAQDMKAGAFLSYLALRALKESGYMPRRELRLVFGTDEERTMEDMRLYLREAGAPDFAYSPDCRFPIVNGEKGAMMWVMVGDYHGALRSFEAGVQPNVIPPHAEAVIEDGTPEGRRVACEGRAAHASMPQLGESAAAKLFKLLTEPNGNTADETTPDLDIDAHTRDILHRDPALRRLAAAFSDPYGEGLGIACDLPPMGRLTINPGIIRISDGKLRVMLDCRYPLGVTSAELTAKLRAFFPDYTITLPYDDPPTYVPDDDPHIAALSGAYESVLGVPCPLEISGGVSYAKVYGSYGCGCVTFGPVGITTENLAHKKNERIPEADCLRALAIYVETLKRLGG